MFTDFGSVMSQYATKEVMTVALAAATLYAGYKGGGKAFNFLSHTARKASFMGLTASVMALVGLGAAGFGVGELRSRPDNTIMSDKLSEDTILTLAKQEHLSADSLKVILDYAAVRAGDPSSVEDAFAANKGTPSSEAAQAVRAIQPVSAEVSMIPVEDASVLNADTTCSMPVAWSMLMAGIGLTVCGGLVYSNRNNARNSHDPHYPAAVKA